MLFFTGYDQRNVAEVVFVAGVIREMDSELRTNRGSPPDVMIAASRAALAWRRIKLPDDVLEAYIQSIVDGADFALDLSSLQMGLDDTAV